MKLHYFFKEAGFFLIVFLFFIAPSIFQTIPNENAFSKWNFPFSILIFAILSFFVVCIEFKECSLKNVFFAKKEKSSFVLISGIFWFGLGALFICAAIFQIIAYFCNYKNNLISISLPNNILSAIFCILTFLFSSVLEENIFRIYLPTFVFNLFANKKLSKLQSLILEIFPAIIFSLCHRYLGIFAVLNAFFAHFILRFCLKKSESPILNYMLHFSYNILNLFFILLA